MRFEIGGYRSGSCLHRSLTSITSLSPTLLLALLFRLSLDLGLDVEDIIAEDLRQTEVDDLQRAVLSFCQEQKVFRLEIPGEVSSISVGGITDDKSCWSDSS